MKTRILYGGLLVVLLAVIVALFASGAYGQGGTVPQFVGRQIPPSVSRPPNS